MSDLDFQEEERLETTYDRRLVAWLLTYARPEWRALAGALALLLVLAALRLAQPQIIRIAIDRVLRPASLAEAAARAALAGDLRVLVLAYVGTVAVAGVVTYGQSLVLRRTGQTIITRIRADTFAHLQSLGLSYFDSRPTGRIVTRVTNDVEALAEMYTSVLVNLFHDVLVIAGAMLLLLQLDARLALMAFAVMPLVVVTAMVFRRLTRAAWRDMRVRLARINATIAETLSGIRVVQAFGREEKSSAEFRETGEAFYRSSLRVIRLFATFGPLLDLITTLTVAGALWLGGARVASGALSFGTLYAFLAYLRMLFEPVNALAEKYNIMQAALAAAERLTELHATEPSVKDPPPGLALVLPPRDGAAPDAGPPAVAFEDVWFAYHDEDWVLRGVSFEVRAGETVAFVGHTGAGKSTIMNLVPRLYDVQRGTVRVHGVDVRRVRQDELRRRVGLVMQDVFLFAGDVAANIHLGSDRIDRDAVLRAGAAVGVDALARRLPRGYDEPVVERGLSLAAGERQLISFARALAYDPDVLILDEATASVDTETEDALRDATRTVARGRTTLIVAHRLATVREADRIFVMHHGRIVEEGDHAGLLQRGGLYHKLWRLQFDQSPGAMDVAGSQMPT